MSVNPVAAQRLAAVERRMAGRRRAAGRIFGVLAGALCAAVALPVIPVAAAAINYGMSFTFDRIDAARVPDCPRDPNATVAGKPFLMTYLEPGERARIRNLLRTMRGSGLSEMEVLVEFTDVKKRGSRLFGIDGAAPLAAALRAYAADVFSAGFSRLFVVIGPEGRLSPACRASQSQRWGECFEPATVSSSIAFVERVRAGLGDGSRLIFNIAPQMCIAPNESALVRANQQMYLPAMVAAYTKAFPRDITGVSCSLERVPTGLKSIDAAYAAVGRRPGFYAISVYPSTNPAANLPAAARALRGTTAPVIVSEIPYGNPPLLRAAIDALGQAPGGLETVFFWPLKHEASKCGIDVAPPYTLRAATSFAR